MRELQQIDEHSMPTALTTALGINTAMNMSSTEKFNEISSLKTPKGVRELMAGSKGQQEWKENCDLVKKANGESYPPFWFGEMILSGLARQTQMKWDPPVG